MAETVIIVFLLIVLVGCAVVFGCDFVPVFSNWLGRIHIGRYETKEQWKSKAEKAALAQIKKLPPMPVTDKTAYTVLPRIKGEYSNKKFNCWQEACLLLGLRENEEAKKAAYAFFEKAELEKQPYTPGTAMLLYALMQSGFEKDEKVKSAANDFCKKALAIAGEGTLPYNVGGVNRYVDVLGMVCPFLVKYHLAYGCPEALGLAKRQIDEYYRFGVHEKTGLPVHCFNAKTKAPLGVYGWGRGCGWLAIALAECYTMLENKETYAAVLKERMDSFAQALGIYQQKNGAFSAMLGSGQRADSSATAILGWFYSVAAKAAEHHEYALRAKTAHKYLMSVTRRDGRVDFAQGDTMGIGNYSRRFEPLPAAQGFALRILENL